VHQETIRHLFAIVYPLADAEVKSWDVYLPLVENIINEAYHSGTGYTPNQLVYGSSAKQSAFLSTSQKHRLGTANVHVFSRNLDNVLKLLHLASVHYQDFYSLKKIEAAKNSPYQYHEYQDGDYVLVTDYTRLNKKKKKLGPRHLGPYQILIDSDTPRVNSDIYELKDLVDPDAKVIRMHADALKPFYVPVVEGQSTAETALAIAARDKDEEKVTAVNNHTQDVARHSLMQFEIVFEDGTTLWMPASKVKFLDVVKQYVLDSPTFPTKWKKYYFLQPKGKRLPQKSRRFDDFAGLPSAISAIGCTDKFSAKAKALWN